MFKLISINKFAIYLIFLVLIMSLVLAIFPSIINLKQLELLAIGLAIASATVLISSLMRRIRSEIRRVRTTSVRSRHKGQKFIIDSPFPASQALEMIHDYISTYRRFKNIKIAKNRLTFSTFNFGIWGSFLFHSSLLIILVAIFIHFGWGSKMVFALTEGESFNSREQSWQYSISGWFADSHDQDLFAFSLCKYTPPDYANGEVRQPGSATLEYSLFNDPPKQLEILYGKGAQCDSYGFILTNWGYSPGLRIVDSYGHELFSGYIRLASVWSKSGRIHEDHYTLPDGKTLDLRLSGRNRLHISIRNSTAAGTLTLTPGTSGTLQDLQIFFPEIRTWNQFELQRNPGNILLYAGLFMSITGLILRILFTRRTLIISLQEFRHYTRITVSTTSEKYRASHYSDMQDLVIEMKHFLNPLDPVLPDLEISQAIQKNPEHAVH